MTIRVLVVDDQELVRHGFVVMLSLADDIEVVGEASNGREAIDLARRERPDVVLMDIHMPDVDGLEATTLILADDRTEACRIVILTTYDADDYVYQAIRAGASGFLLKDTSLDELVRAVRVVAGGDALLAPSVTRRLLGTIGASGPVDDVMAARMAELTEREAEVLRAITAGGSNNEIADRLHMSYGTVKTHVSHLLTKLDCRDRAQLVIAAYESGFISPGDTAG